MEELSSHKCVWSWSYWYAAIQHKEKGLLIKLFNALQTIIFVYCLIPLNSKADITTSLASNPVNIDLQSNLLALWNWGLCIMAPPCMTSYLKTDCCKKPESLQLLRIFWFLLFVLLPEMSLRQKRWKVSWKHLWLCRTKSRFALSFCSWH